MDAPLPAQPSSCRRAVIAAGIGLWGLAAVAGSFYNLRYALTPGASGTAPADWPAGTACTLSWERPTLLMFVHPRCPCSRASLHELAVLLSRCRDCADVAVLFFAPAGADAQWAKSDLWSSAQRIPGVVTKLDLDGVEQRRFDARVSGETFLYRPDGRLAFHGGITAARGHEGESAGRLALESLLLGSDLPPGTTPVFGCELQSRRTAADENEKEVAQ